MEALSLLLEYLYAPMSIALYILHIKYIRLETKLHDYVEFKKDVYDKINRYLTEVHYLLKIREEEKK